MNFSTLTYKKALRKEIPKREHQIATHQEVVRPARSRSFLCALLASPLILTPFLAMVLSDT
jgi:hypothetical protein